MKRSEWTQGKDKEYPSCKDCKNPMPPYHQQGETGRCLDCHKREIEEEEQKWLETDAYYISRNFPNNTPEQNWEIAKSHLRNLQLSQRFSEGIFRGWNVEGINVVNPLGVQILTLDMNNEEDDLGDGDQW